MVAFAHQARYAARRVPRRYIAGAALVCAPLLARASRAESAPEVLMLVRLVSLTLAASSAYALHDPSAALTESTQPGRMRLRVLAAMTALAVVVSVWLPLVGAIDLVTRTSLRSAVPGLFVELTAMCATGWLIVSLMAHNTSTRLSPGWAAAGLVLITAATLTNTHTRGWLWVAPGAEWRIAHLRWTVITAAAVLTFGWSSRDPARSSLTSRVNRKHHSSRQRCGTSA